MVLHGCGGRWWWRIEVVRRVNGCGGGVGVGGVRSGSGRCT